MNARSAPAEQERSTVASDPQAPLRDGEVHVWHGTLDAEPGPVSPAEEARARRMRSPRRRREFLVCRGALRRVLGETLGIDPLAVPIREGAHGKPRLAYRGSTFRGPPRIGFNVSHSDARFIVALALGMDPGVDVERIRPRRDLAGLARRFFSPAEQRAVADAPDPLLAFHRVWTRKEAVIKADGRGVSIDLRRFDVSAGDPPILLGARWEGAAADEAASWFLHTLDTGPDHAAALAVRRPRADVVIRAVFRGSESTTRSDHSLQPPRR